MIKDISVTLLLGLVLLAVACRGSNGGSDTYKPSPAVTVAPAGERSSADRPDDEIGPQVHLIYVLPSDGTDRHLDTGGTIRESFEAVQEWLRGETGGRGLRLDTYEGEPDISFFSLSRDDADMQASGAFVRDDIEAEMERAGFDDSDKVYAVYYDGGSTYACGSGAWPPTLEGNVAALFLRGLPLGGSIRCGDNEFATSVDAPAFWEFVALHEILHTLGFVPTCSPNDTFDGHISGPGNDLMYEGEEESSLPKALDAGKDDYYTANIPRCLDFSESDYLAP